jgi:CBS domain-containing protein
MTTDVQTMSPEISIGDAMDMLVAHHIGGAPVVANRQVRGIITTTDLLAFAASLLEEVAEFMQRTGVHRVLVSEKGELAGIVTSMDLARAIAEHKILAALTHFGPDSAFDVRGWDLSGPRVSSGERTE